MNDEARFVFAFENLRNDLIEGNDFHFNARREQFERQVGGGEFAGYRDFLVLDFVRREGDVYKRQTSECAARETFSFCSHC